MGPSDKPTPHGAARLLLSRAVLFYLQSSAVLVRLKRLQSAVDQRPGNIHIGGNGGNALAFRLHSCDFFQIGFAQRTGPAEFNAFGLRDCPAFGCGLIDQGALELGDGESDS